MSDIHAQERQNDNKKPLVSAFSVVLADSLLLYIDFVFVGALAVAFAIALAVALAVA